MDLLTALVHEIGHVLGYRDVSAPSSTTVMTGTLPAGVRRMLSEVDLGSHVAAFPNFMGPVTSGIQKPDRPMSELPAVPPVIDWGEEESTRQMPVALGGVQLKSSWLSKFLSATGTKPERAAADAFEVALPKKK